VSSVLVMPSAWYDSKVGNALGQYVQGNATLHVSYKSSPTSGDANIAGGDIRVYMRWTDSKITVDGVEVPSAVTAWFYSVGTDYKGRFLTNQTYETACQSWSPIGLATYTHRVYPNSYFRNMYVTLTPESTKAGLLYRLTSTAESDFDNNFIYWFYGGTYYRIYSVSLTFSGGFSSGDRLKA